MLNCKNGKPWFSSIVSKVSGLCNVTGLFPDLLNPMTLNTSALIVSLGL